MLSQGIDVIPRRAYIPASFFAYIMQSEAEIAFLTAPSEDYRDSYPLMLKAAYISRKKRLGTVAS